MATKSLAIIGNSISAGAYATSMRYSLHALLLERLRMTGEHWRLLTYPYDSWPRLGHAYLQWARVRSARPDLLVIAGLGENDYSNTAVYEIGAHLSIDSQQVTFNAGPTEGRPYIITDGTDEEMVIPLWAAGSTGHGCIRGACGTKRRAWEAGSTVLTWPNNANQPALRKAMYYILRQICRESTGIILCGAGDAFAGNSAGHAPTLQKVIAQLRDEGCRHLYPVLFSDAFGNELFRPGQPTAYTGPTDTLAAALDTEATAMTLTSGDRINAGDYVVISSASGLPSHGDSEIVKVGPQMSKTVRAITRAQLGSTARSFSAGHRVMRISQAYITPRATWADIGTAGNWWALGMSHDRHPWDTGYIELADRYWEAYQAAVAEMR